MTQRVVLLALLGLALNGYYANAQTFLGAQFVIAPPEGPFRSDAATGYGGLMSYMYYMTPTLSLTGSLGYIRWGPRQEAQGVDYDVRTVPLTLGLQVLLAKNPIAPYAGFSVGMHLLRTNHRSFQQPEADIDESNVYVGLSPSVGVATHLGKNMGFFITGLYTVVLRDGSSTRYFALNGGLIFGL